ncbi:hypothetical protein G9A89_015267 [Geosiphon pyriformis]|nr:hypothetical protein G9A89_015267 [Geosiphon pyriformis]
MEDVIELPLITKRKFTYHPAHESESKTSIFSNESRDENDEKSLFSEEQESDDDDTSQEENSPIPMVAATISTKDDPSLPSITFRFWALSSVGPFNVKEHVCIAVATGSGGGSAYGTDIIAIQELFYKQEVNFLQGILLLLSTQMIGYGLAGFLRKYLVRPSNMVWPSNLVFASMFNTLHGNAKDTKNQLRFFKITLLIVFIWQFLPQYFFTWLTSIAVLCLVFPAHSTIKKLGSGYHGVGILDFSLDWNAIGQSAPLYTPFFSCVNWYFGVILGAWVIAPLLYFNNVLEAQRFPFLATYGLDKNGERYNQTALIDPFTGSLNETAYEEIGPVYLSVTFASSYFFSFVLFPAALSHVFLFYGKDIWQRFKANKSEEKEDIHLKMMKVYPDIPNWWYGVIFFMMLFVAIFLGYTTEANLPWWGVLLAVGLAAFMVLPIGVIQAISNNCVGLNVIAEILCGYVLPGRPIANVYFKCYGYMAMSQCLWLVSDLKLGLYMKIPPKAMFISQTWGTFLGVFINYWVLKLIIAAKRPFLDGTMLDPTGQWTGFRSQMFNTQSVLWGLIGPTRTFGKDSLYHPLLWGFFIGFVAPIPLYFLHRKYPSVRFDLVNVPIICSGLTMFPGTYTNFIIMGFGTCILSQYWCQRHHYSLYKKYNYILSAALDSGTQFATLFIFFFLDGVMKISSPEWWGNNRETQGERCFGPD